jgi:hypothetical protein
MENIAVTTEQIRLMKHTIGFEQSKVKRGKYEAYRNYFCAGKPMPEFEDLMIKMLAVSATRQGQIFYFLTSKGIDLVAEITGVKITERD